MNDNAAAANEKIRQEKLAYESTTKPMNEITQELRDMKKIIEDIFSFLKKTS